MTGIDVSGRVIILSDLQQEMEDAAVSIPNGLTIAASSPAPSPAFPPPPYPPLPEGTYLFTYDDQGEPVDLPVEAEPIVSAYTPTLP
jgi:hypothetical protein